MHVQSWADYATMKTVQESKLEIDSTSFFSNPKVFLNESTIRICRF